MSMNIITLVVSIVLLVVAVALIIVVLLQDTQGAGLSGAVGGNADTFYGKNKSRTLDAFLNKWTKIIAIAFFILVIGCDLLMFL